MTGSFHVAMQTLLAIRHAVTTGQWNNLDGLTEMIKNMGHRIVEAQPLGSPFSSMPWQKKTDLTSSSSSP